MPTKQEIHKFSVELRMYASEKKLGLWEALLLQCQITGREPEVAASLLSKAALADIFLEAQDLNLLKKREKKSGRLPL